MPEGPEVLDYYNFIKPFLYGNTLLEFNVLSGKYTSTPIKNIEYLQDCLPCEISDIEIKGKTIFIVLKNNYSFVITHGMTGYWSDENENHARIEFKMDKMSLYYVDPRNFGTINICITENELNKSKDKLGPYIFSKNMSYELFYSRIDKKPKSKIAVALLDQNLISGIGNYLRCDILWYVRINGEKRINELDNFEKQMLYKACINICKYHANLPHKLKITPCDYDRDFYIYMQEYDIHGNEVYTKKLNGRTFHYTC
jgi:formamidopyrimidine-DNA glycosylase